MLLPLKLLLSHLLGDFILQPVSWVENKRRNKIRSPYLYAHVAIHGALVHVLIGDWMITWVIVASHTAIDVLKLVVQTRSSRRKWFFYDQLLHLFVIAAIVVAYQVGYDDGFDIELLSVWMNRHLALITGIVFLTAPASVLIKNLIARWEPVPDDRPSNSANGDSLEKAGAYIGILERLLVFAFVLMGQWNAVGFLIAAKSIFRFGNLRESSDRKLTEYVLIGTLLSIGLATVVGAFVRQL